MPPDKKIGRGIVWRKSLCSPYIIRSYIKIVHMALHGRFVRPPKRQQLGR